MTVIVLSKEPVQRAEAVAQVTKLISALSLSYTWKVEVKRQVMMRSSEQNRYYHAVPLRMIAEQTGHDAEEMKAYLCGERFGWESYEVMGKTLQRPVKTTSQLSTDEFIRLIDFTIAWAAQELAMVIPYPNEVIT